MVRIMFEESLDKIMRTRICKYCDNFFKTYGRFAEVCEDCKEKRKKEKYQKIVVNNLFYTDRKTVK